MKAEKYVTEKGDYLLIGEPRSALAVLKSEPPDKKLDYTHPLSMITQREALEYVLQTFIDKGSEGLLPQQLPPDVLYAIGSYDKYFYNVIAAAVAYIKNDRYKDGRYKIELAKFTDYALNYMVACQTEYVRQIGFVDLTHPPTVDTVLDVSQKERTEIIYTEEAKMELQRIWAEKN
jgi:hypothetical protein